MGAYDINEAARLLGITTRTLASWANPSASGLPPITTPSKGWAYTFHDLVSLAVAAVLRQRSISVPAIRRSHAYLQDVHGVARPFAREDIVDGLATAWGAVITSDDGVDVSQHGQMVMLEVVTSYLVPLSYDSDQLAHLWRPRDLVLLDPAIQVGQPCVAGSRITTTTVAGRYRQGESMREISGDLNLTMPQARACLDFEGELAKGKGLALLSAA